MKLRLIFGLTLIFCFGMQLQGQDVKIPKSKVPEAVAEFVSSNYPTAKNIQYFKELINDSLFVEIKLVFRSEKYALRFHEEKLYEEEIELGFKEIPTSTRTALETTLSDLFSKYKILKCQEVNPKTHLLYEINVKGTDEKTTAFWELFFNTKGELIKKSEVIVEPIPSYF